MITEDRGQTEALRQTSAGSTSSRPRETARQAERRSQVRGLMLIALAVLLFSLLRAGLHHVFTAGWWRLW